MNLAGGKKVSANDADRRLAFLTALPTETKQPMRVRGLSALPGDNGRGSPQKKRQRLF
jgi:hypothetical protein